MAYLAEKSTKYIYKDLGDSPVVDMAENNLAVIICPGLTLYGTDMERFEIHQTKEGLKERPQPLVVDMEV